MSDQTESERPRKRTKIVQTTLGFDAEREDDHVLLSHVLAFVASSKDLSRTRQVCRAFRKCSDKIASARTSTLIGGSIKPMIGQSVVGLLHGAEEADDRTRNALKAWNGDMRTEGFDLGLPTKKEENQRWHIRATVPCDPWAAGASVPLTLELNCEAFDTSARSARVTCPRLPKGFFHTSACSGGTFCLCDRVFEYASERNLNDTLRRIKTDLLREDRTCLHNPATAIFWGHREASPSLYKEYVALCMNVFSGYKLGQPIPKLDLFQKLLETKTELMEKDNM